MGYFLLFGVFVDGEDGAVFVAGELANSGGYLANAGVPLRWPLAALESSTQRSAIRSSSLREGAPSKVPFERAIAIGKTEDNLTLFNELKARTEIATFQWKTGEIAE
jgi:hypothetical protein